VGIIRDTLRDKVADGLSACIGCRECLRACPVAPPGLRIADLNHWTAGDAPLAASAPIPTPVSPAPAATEVVAVADAAISSPAPPAAMVARLAEECFQCGMCVPVCPSGLERDAMVLWLKSRLTPRPAEYDASLRRRGPAQTVGEKVGVTVHNLLHRGRLGSLSRHVDKRSLQPADTLFFFGCNIFSTTGMGEKILAIADYLKCRYEVLGGLSSCCGWSSYLSGDLDGAGEMMSHLAGRIAKVAPKEVITPGSECYAALSRIAAVHRTPFTPVTVASWLRRNLHRFPLRHFPGTMTFHDACHSSRKLGEGEEPRRILRQLGALVEMRRFGDDAPCCGHHQFGVNPAQVEALRADRLAMARDAGAARMVVECVRCQESFAPGAEAAQVEVLSLVDLVYDLLPSGDRPQARPVHFAPPVQKGDQIPIEGM